MYLPQPSLHSSSLQVDFGFSPWDPFSSVHLSLLMHSEAAHSLMLKISALQVHRVREGQKVLPSKAANAQLKWKRNFHVWKAIYMYKLVWLILPNNSLLPSHTWTQTKLTAPTSQYHVFGEWALFGESGPLKPNWATLAHRTEIPYPCCKL